MYCNKDKWAISRIARSRGTLDLDPVYQREGGVWSLEKKQLFIDSILNNFDVPKIYVHNMGLNDSGKQYGVIDGKQRITTLLDFIDGKFPLGEDFNYQDASSDFEINKSSYFEDFVEDAKNVFREKQLDFVVVETNDLDDIEELFSRLNNGEKLNAAEQRNAFGGKMSGAIRDLAKTDFFSTKFGFQNKRYGYLEIAAKLLYIEECEGRLGKGNGFVDLKKRHLDKFVRDNKGISDSDLNKLIEAVNSNLNWMKPIFDSSDRLLSKQSFPQLFYLFTKNINREYAAVELQSRVREFLNFFAEERIENTRRPEDEMDSELTEYGRLTQQGTNDADSMRKRVAILKRRFLRMFPDTPLKDSKRLFDEDERYVIWLRAGKRCEACSNQIAFDEMQADHIVTHSQGGQTSLENGRCLCVSCNTSRKHN
jgi:hypothetical protein